MVEVVFRQVGTADPTALGSNAMTTRDSWGNPDIDWRKREVFYIRTVDRGSHTDVSCCNTGVVWCRTDVSGIRAGSM